MSRLQWYARRLRAMSVGEAAFRARRAAETVGEDALWHAVPATWRRTWEPPPARLLRAAPAAAVPYVLGGERAAAAAGAAPDEAARVVAAAELALRSRVRFFGYPEAEIDEGVQRRDPFTGGAWPDRHAKRLDYRAATAGDPKWVWEVNRLQQLPLLCLAAAISGRDELAAFAARRALAWAREARPPYGIPWSNGFEAGLRGISLALTLDALRGSPHLDQAATETLLRSLWQHARWIRRDPSRGSSANNHLLGEAVGLAAIGLLAPELRDAARFAEEGLTVVAREADVQVLPDGAGAEQAFAYHLFVCDLLLLVTSLTRACRGDEPPAPVLAALHRSGDAIAAQVAPGEPDPAYGDADDGRAFLFDAQEIRDARGVAASIAAAVGHAACASLAGRPDLPALVLFGAEGASRFAAPGAGHAPSSAVLPDAGLVVLRRDGIRVLFDGGSLGYLGIAAHGHADALSLWLSDGPDELVADPGTGTYFGDAAARHAFRSTLAHATASVGGDDQAAYGGPFLWLDHPEARLVHVDLEHAVAVAEVTGRWRHVRAVVVLLGGEIVVYDRIDGDPVCDRIVSWPLHPALTASVRGPGVVEAALDGRPKLLVAVAGRVGAAEPQVKLVEGEWSRRLERAEPTTVVRAHAPASARTELVTLLVPARGASAADPQLELTADGGEACVAAFRLGDAHTRHVRFDLADPVDVRVAS